MDFLKDIKKASDLLMIQEDKYQEILLKDIWIDPSQPRKEFIDIDELAESIKIHGVLSPITVRKTKVDGSNNVFFVLCYGERRYRAAEKAGLISIPAVVIDGDIEDLKEKQLVENIQRKELSFDEIAETIKYLIEIKKMKKKDIAKSLSKSNSYISLYYSYAKIEGYIKSLLTDKTKDITLIVEINKFLCNAEAEIKDAALQCILNEDSINRNFIEKLNNLVSNDNELVVTEDDLVRPNINDYIEDAIEADELCNFDEMVNKDENNKVDKYDIAPQEYNNEVIDNRSNKTDVKNDNDSDKDIVESLNNNNDSKQEYKNDYSKMWFDDIYINSKKQVCNANSEVLLEISDKFYDYLKKNNKLDDFVKYILEVRV